MAFIESRRRLLAGIPVQKVCQKLQGYLTQEEIKDICSDSSETRMTKLLYILCKKPQKYQEWYLDLLVALQDLDYSAIAEGLESKTDLKVRIGRVWLKFIKIGNPGDVMKRMMNRGILNSDEIRTLNVIKYKEQKMSSLGDVLGKKDGRNLPLISRCLLEEGHRSVAEELLHSSREELDEYSAGS
ncbi:unnamed protein product, partial [Darwinula stevensoni]